MASRQPKHPHGTLPEDQPGVQRLQVRYYDFPSGRNQIRYVTGGVHTDQNMGGSHPPGTPEETCDVPRLWG